MAGQHDTEAAEVVSFALSAEERRFSADPRIARYLTEWAGFYRGFFGQPDRALDLLTRAEVLVRACCGAVSRQMEPVLDERVWLTAAMAWQAASIPYLEQLRTLRISIYGEQSRQVEQSTSEIAWVNGKAGH